MFNVKERREINIAWELRTQTFTGQKSVVWLFRDMGGRGVSNANRQRGGWGKTSICLSISAGALHLCQEQYVLTLMLPRELSERSLMLSEAPAFPSAAFTERFLKRCQVELWVSFVWVSEVLAGNSIKFHSPPVPFSSHPCPTCQEGKINGNQN